MPPPVRRGGILFCALPTAEKIRLALEAGPLCHLADLKVGMGEKLFRVLDALVEYVLDRSHACPLTEDTAEILAADISARRAEHRKVDMLPEMLFDKPGGGRNEPAVGYAYPARGVYV